MKKSFVLGAAAVLLLSLAGCAGFPGASASSGPSGSSGSTGRGLGGVPDFVNEAWQSASEDVLIGIGTYRIGNDMTKMGTGKTFAETRARADLARQLSVMVRDMVTDHAATSEVDQAAAVSFQESITQTLSRAQLRGSRIVKMDTDNNGLLWVVMEYGKSAAAAEVDQAANAAKLAVPAMIAFDAIDRMDTAFAKEAGGGPVPVGD
jgi:hypothetical protein